MPPDHGESHCTELEAAYAIAERLSGEPMKPQSAGGMTKCLSDTCFIGDCREVLKTLIAEDLRVQMCVTSPPYWGLRDYGMAGQIGLERTPGDYVAVLVEVFRLVRDLLADQGTLWLNLGDCYATGAGTIGECPGGCPGGSLEGLSGTRPGSQARFRCHGSDDPAQSPATAGPQTEGPRRHPLARRLRAAIGWWTLRSDIIWHKPNCMPEPRVDRDRPQSELHAHAATPYRADGVGARPIDGERRRFEMSLLSLQRAAWFLVASTGAALAADTARIEVFTTAGTPIAGISAPAVRVYTLDAPALIEAEINSELSRDPSTTHRYAQRALKRQWHEAAERLTQADRGLLRGSQYGLEKLPAIVFDGRAVVYGITDLDQALGDYQRWKARSP